MKERLCRFADRFAGELERRPLWWVGFFTIPYLAITVMNALVRSLWFDEIFTWHVSRLPRVQDIWTALATGYETNPPLPFLLTRWSMSLFGEGHLGVRFPAIVGFWLMCVCLFFFVRRRCSAVHAAFAMVFPLLTYAYWYASEARGYGLVLGFSGLALLCWQAAEGRGRRWALAGLALSVAVAISSHYYAVLIVCPIALGEVVRSFTRRRIDLWVWLMFALGLAPLGLYLPLIRSALANVYSYSAQSTDFWTKPTPVRMIEFYTYLLRPAAPAAVVGALVAALALKLGLQAGRAEERPPREGPATHEMAAVVGFVLLPVFVLIITAAATGYYMDRYGIPAVIGCASLAGFLLHLAARARTVFGVALLGAFLGCFALAEVVGKAYPPPVQQPVLRAGHETFPKDDDLPIAVSNALRFLQMTYYGSPEVTSRICFLSYPQVAVRQPDFIPELVLHGLKRWAPIRVEDYASFIASHRAFWVYYYSSGQLEWLLAQLRADGRKVELRAQDRDVLLFLVTAPSQGRTAPGP